MEWFVEPEIRQKIPQHILIRSGAEGLPATNGCGFGFAKPGWNWGNVMTLDLAFETLFGPVAFECVHVSWTPSG